MKTLIPILLALPFVTPPLRAAAPQDIVFPPPPDAPRIRFVRAVSNKRDLAGKRRGAWEKLWNVITGAEREGLALMRPYGLWVQGGRIFVADTEGASVVVLDTEKVSMERLGAGAQERLTSPISVAVDASSRAFVSDSAMNAVKAYSPEGKLLWQAAALGAEAGELKKPTGVSIGRGDEVLVADTGNARIVVLSAGTGAYLREFGKKGSGPGKFSIPTNLWVEQDGTVLVSDSILCRVQAFSPKGKFLFQFGECGDKAGYMARPRGVASDSEGNIYVVDALFNAVQLFNREGRLLMFFGGSGAGPASFQLPAGIFIDASDRIYVADSYNRRVQIFQYIKKKM